MGACIREIKWSVDWAHAPHHATCNPPLHSPTLQPNSVPSHPTSGLPLELGTQQVLEVLLQEACVSRGLAYPRIG